ncbi:MULTISPECIES: hypothetical protein [unclassified Rhodococcus (in: high G+C Gram-positive bacteria)]|uniref:hypothetical protein n=1 Tax=unclassified Rhodococcus (in: high G+C Gram-positive bacteria) TaxID=192944 RepID=UPI00144544D8|nr:MULTISPECIES: hypothetical protein [unclassified Rhodococcus (in: high G+C Gram-positive bacteria)]
MRDIRSLDAPEPDPLGIVYFADSDAIYAACEHLVHPGCSTDQSTMGTIAGGSRRPSDTPSCPWR